MNVSAITINMNNEMVFDFTPTTNLDEIKRYDGFVDKDGRFYKVSIKNKHHPSHHEWADKFVTEKLNYVSLLSNPSGSTLFILSQLKNKLNILIHYYGFVYYGHDELTRKPIIIYPIHSVNQKEVTKEQNNMLFEILLINNELNDYHPDFYDKVKYDFHNAYVDGLISERLYNNKGGKNG